MKSLIKILLLASTMAFNARSTLATDLPYQRHSLYSRQLGEI